MGMVKTLINTGLIAVFVISIITFATVFAVDNDSELSISNDDRFGNLNSTLRGQLSDLTEDSNISKNILFSTTLESGDEHASGGGQFKIGPYDSAKIAVSSLKDSFNIIFGGDSSFSFIIILFSTLFTFIVGYFIVKAWLGRDPD